jgi:hypothetical protein
MCHIHDESRSTRFSDVIVGNNGAYADYDRNSFKWTYVSKSGYASVVTTKRWTRRMDDVATCT